MLKERGEKMVMSTIKNVTGNVVSAVEIMQFMTHNSLLLYKKKGSRVSHDRVIAYETQENHNPYRKGCGVCFTI